MSMPLREGYKQTEVGVIPKDWDVRPFGELFAFSNGVNADKDCYGRGFPFVNVLEPITYSHIYGPEITGRVTVSDSVATAYAVRLGDVLFNRTSETDAELGLATTYLGTEHILFGGFVIRGHPINDSLDPKYCGYALRAQAIRSQIIPLGQGAVRANIGQQSLKLVVAPIPSLAEQRAIAEALSDADALIESLKQLVTKKRHLKQGAMQELLSGTKRLPGFSMKWKMKRLGDVLTISHGKSQHAVTDRNGMYPILATGGQIGTTKKFLHDKPSVLIGRKGTIDQPQYIDTPFWTIDTLFYSVIHEPNIAKFLFFCFCLIDWKQHNEASGVPSLNARTIEKIEIMIPDPDEQTAIANILSDMDAEIVEVEAQLAKARAIKQGMMTNLLTGKIRLI